jgi:excisionase family DNA binding protein
MTKTATAQSAVADDEDFLTPAEAQRILRCSRSCIYAALTAGDLPYVRVGRLIRIPRASLTPGNQPPDRHLQRRIGD